MINQDSVVIERKSGVTIYAKVINPQGKVGKFEVVSDFHKNEGATYHTLTDAQKRMDVLIGYKNN